MGKLLQAIVEKRPHDFKKLAEERMRMRIYEKIEEMKPGIAAEILGEVVNGEIDNATDLTAFLDSLGVEYEIYNDHIEAELTRQEDVEKIVTALSPEVDWDLITFGDEVVKGGEGYDEEDEDEVEIEATKEDILQNGDEWTLIIYLYNTNATGMNEGKEEDEDESEEDDDEKEEMNEGKSDRLKGFIGKVFDDLDSKFEKWSKSDVKSYNAALDYLGKQTGKGTGPNSPASMIVADYSEYRNGITSKEKAIDAVVAAFAKKLSLKESVDEFGEFLLEVKRIIKINAKGKRRIKMKCKKGYKWTGGKCVKISGSELTSKRRAIKKAVRTKKSKGAGFKRRVLRLRKKALRKRKAMGL